MILRRQSCQEPGRNRARDRRGPLLAWVVAAATVAVAGLFSPGDALAFALSAAATWWLVPHVARFALRKNATVLPGGRAVHVRRMPLLGGLAIFLPLAVFLVAQGENAALGLAAGCALMVAAGALDDLRGLSPRLKIAVQVAGALILFATGYRAPALEMAPFGSLETTGFEVLAVVAWVVLVTNAVNLIDGMDGLAALYAFVAAGACALLGFLPGAALVLAGATLGFLRHNLPPARIFLGDAGSLLLGFALAAFLLSGPGPVNVPLALGLIALPLGDVLVSTGRRWLRGKPIFTADRRHVHHRLLELWGPVGALAGLGLLAATQATAAALLPDAGGLVAVALAWLLVLGYLVAKRRPGFGRILVQRKSFRRIHLARRYAHQALDLAESEAEVKAIMERVAEDFQLSAIRLRGVQVKRVEGAADIEEQVDCGESRAAWSAPASVADPVLSEERRTVLCDLLRTADSRLATLSEPASAPDRDEGFRVVPQANPAGLPHMHFIAEGKDRLRQVSPLVREVRRRGNAEPLVIHTGRRDDLGLTAAQLRELGLEAPAVDLDVPAGDGSVHTARVMERYHALLEAGAPAAVVVGDCGASVACALVAKERGLAIARVGVNGNGSHGRAVTQSLADLVLDADEGTRPAGAQRAGREQFLFPAGTEAEAARVAPALETLLEPDTRPPSAVGHQLSASSG